MNCPESGCSGQIEDGYCNECGLAPTQSLALPLQALTSSTRARTASTGRTSKANSLSNRFGAGLVEIAPVPSRDPIAALLKDPQVPEEKRYCTVCRKPIGRGHDGSAGLSEPFCTNCGIQYSFIPKLLPGDLVAGQYEIAGCLAHGGLGWIYLARDRPVDNRWVVLKGLLNSGDSDSVAAALAERRFLAQVKHSNIVSIYNFVEHKGEGYIVMEYVDGVSLRKVLEERREENGGTPNPLSPQHAIAYILEILPALGYLHSLGLLFCDFKPDNVIQTAGSLKLIDLGGVYRMDDQSSAVYGTVGYQAPEVAMTGPSVASDLFTVGRTLAVLCTNFRGYQSTYEFTLPLSTEVPVYAAYDSLYRFLLRATAEDPDERFQSSEEMADQLLGVLREVVAIDTDAPSPGRSTLFSGELRGSIEGPTWQSLPTPLMSADDPSAGLLATMATYSAAEVASLLQVVPDPTPEVNLRLTRALIEMHRFPEIEEILTNLRLMDIWDWRVDWYRGLAALAAGDSTVANDCFTRVYAFLPGELAPKLGLACAAENAGDNPKAAQWYDRVSRTDSGFVGAAFGLGRCLETMGERERSIDAYDRVPETSSSYVDAQLAKARALIRGPNDHRPDLADIQRASDVAADLRLPPYQRTALVAEALESALKIAPEAMDSPPSAFGTSLVGRDVRIALERAYRELARHAGTTAERVRLVDRANAVRPRTLV
jgi:serine/threonine-protein kinase PknG